MPLSQEQIQQRRQMTAEARRDLDLFRIAESLEGIEAALKEVVDVLRTGGGTK